MRIPMIDLEPVGWEIVAKEDRPMTSADDLPQKYFQALLDRRTLRARLAAAAPVVEAAREWAKALVLARAATVADPFDFDDWHGKSCRAEELDDVLIAAVERMEVGDEQG